MEIGVRHGVLLARLAFALAAGAVSAPLALDGVAGAQAQVTVSFVQPADNDYVSGPMVVRVQVAPPDAPVKSLSLFADGRLLCSVETPPYECPWDAGAEVVAHTLRAVAVLTDGTRVPRTIRTRSGGYTEAVDVDVVHLSVTVTDEGGRFVKGLQRPQFKVWEDDVLQQVGYFTGENAALEIVVALDVSGSMTDAMPRMKQAAQKFVSALRPQDRVTVVGFNDNVFTLARPGVDLAGRLRAIGRLAPWGGTSLYDAVVNAADQLGRQPGRHVLVVFTDGDDQDSHVPARVAESRLEASDITLYPIGQGRAAASRALKDVLERLARTTGGRAFFLEAEELDAAFAAIVEELSNQYLLSYAPKNPRRDGAWRAVRVEVNDRALKVRHRQGYRFLPK